MSVTYIAIDGPGGSGKTHLANQLGERLHATVLHLDDFGDDFKPFVGIPALVEAIRHEHGDIVIFEGVGVFDETFKEFQPLKIFVNTAPEIRRERAAFRDIVSQDRSAEDWKTIYAIWRDAEEAYFADALVRTAHVVTDAGGTVDIENLAQRILNP